MPGCLQPATGFATRLADVVYVNAGLPLIPAVWLDGLRPGGRLIFPFQPLAGFGAMLRIERPATGVSWPARSVTPAGFIGCQGGQDDAAGRRLAAAISSGRGHTVRSLRRDGVPDATCWLAGEGWWLSTAEPDVA